MAALLKRQHVASGKTASVAGPSSGTTSAVAKTVSTNLTPAQLLAQAGLQAQQPGQVTALVKTAQSTHMPVTGLTLPQVISIINHYYAFFFKRFIQSFVT